MMADLSRCPTDGGRFDGQTEYSLFERKFTIFAETGWVPPEFCTLPKFLGGAGHSPIETSFL